MSLFWLLVWIGKPIILVLMHHSRDVDYSPGGKNWVENYQEIVLQVHVLFHETEPGLLQCDINKQAVREIFNELCNHKKCKGRKESPKPKGGFFSWFSHKQ